MIEFVQKDFQLWLDVVVVFQKLKKKQVQYTV